MALFSSYSFVSAPTFSAIQYNPITRSKQELADEEAKDLAKNSSTIQSTQSSSLSVSVGGSDTSASASVSVQSTQQMRFSTTDSATPSSNSTYVMFNDPKSGMRIQVELSNDNLKRLQDKFGKDEFYQRSDGVVRLSGKAEAFVSGWFGDLAYRQNYLGADANKDGKIDKSEFEDLRIGVKYDGGIIGNHYQETSAQGYYQLSKEWFEDREAVGVTTLAGALNHVLESDEDLDGVLLSDEGQSYEEQVEKFDKAFGISAIDQTEMSGEAVDMGDGTMKTPREILMEGLRKLLEQQKLIEKLREKKGDTTTLTAEERELLGAFTSKTNLSTQELDELQDKMHNQTLDELSKKTGISSDDLRDTIIKSVNALANKNATPLDKDLESVIDELNTQIRNNSVVTFDMKA